MKRTILFSIALLALVGSTVGLSGAESESFPGTAAASGTFNQPLQIVDGGVSTELDRHRYRSYEYTEAGGTFRLTLPEGLEVVRGILVVGPYAGADSREFYREVWYRDFLHLHDFAFLGTHGVSMQNYKLMRNALKQFAADSRHLELVHAPYVATGFSAGGGLTRRLLLADPDKVIAAVIVGSTLKLAITPTAAHLGTPVCVINGELEGGGMAELLEPVLAEYRPQGALWGWMAVPGAGHEQVGQEVLAMPMLDAAVRLRYPADGDVRKGPVKLKAVDPSSGWIADNTTWKSGLTAITPAKDFKGDLARSSWLLNEDLAFIYRAYATYNRPLKITSPHARFALGSVLDAGSSISIAVDDSRFAGWKTLQLYDGSKKVDELAKGSAGFTVKDLKAGYHAFSVLGTDSKGNARPSNPVLVVVRKLATRSQ
jgi:predicted esterase